MTTNAEDFKKVVNADVYKSGVLVGQLSRTGGGIEFRYRDEYAGPSVSLGLPDRGGSRGAKGAERFRHSFPVCYLRGID